MGTCISNDTSPTNTGYEGNSTRGALCAAVGFITPQCHGEQALSWLLTKKKGGGLEGCCPTVFACEPSHLSFPPTASSCRAVLYTRPGPSRAVPHPSFCSQEPANGTSPTLRKECVLLLLPIPDRRSFQSPRSTFPSQVIRLEYEGRTPVVIHSLCGPALQGRGYIPSACPEDQLG